MPNQTETTISDNGQQEHDGIPGSGQGTSHQGQPPSHQGQGPSHQGQPPSLQGQPPTHQGQPPTHQCQPASHQGQEHNSPSSSEGAQSISNVQPVCGLKTEKPKMHRFSGDVREYRIFRDDFKHAIESRYSKRDAMTYLCACLQGKPLELIKGIGTDHDGAWQYLDSIYGDPRYVSDQVTQDLSKFRPLKEGEDSRFCDLVHLVKLSFNTEWSFNKGVVSIREWETPMIWITITCYR